MRRHTGALRFECKACRKEFSITSGTLFASHKLPLRTYLAAIAVFVNEVKGKSMLALSRDLGLSYKSAFVLCHKMREAMAEEMKGRTIGGAGKVAEVDGGYFGGYSSPRTTLKTALTVASLITATESANPSSSFASATAIPSQRSSPRKAHRSTGSSRASSREQL
jgi:hypothetical protein